MARDEFYERSQLYGTPKGDYFDNLERFAFFQRRGAACLPGPGFPPGCDPLPRLAELSGAGLPEEPLGLGRYAGRDQDRLDHS